MTKPLSCVEGDFPEDCRGERPPCPLRGLHMIKKLMVAAASAALLAMSGAAFADEGMVLAQKNACLSCHGVDKKIVGPAYREVAKK